MNYDLFSVFRLRTYIPALTLSLIAPVLLAIPGQAANNIDFSAVNQNLTRNYVLPHYEFFASSSEQMRNEIKEFCEAPSKGGLHLAQRAFNDALDTFIEIGHIRFGRILDQNRYQRLYFWPDKENKVDQTLENRIASGQDDAVKDISRGPAEIQGFPALGRLIFGVGTDKLLSGDEEASLRCQFAVGIAGNIASLAGQINAEWREGPSAFAKLMETAGEPGNAAYPTTSAGTKAFLDSMTNALKLITEVKLPLILKAASEPGDIKSAECWCSGRSLRNIKINLESLREMYKGVNGAGFDDALLRANVGWLYNDIESGFRNAIKLIDSIDDTPQALTSDVEVRRQLKSLIPLVEKLQDLVQKLHKLLDRDLRVVVE